MVRNDIMSKQELVRAKMIKTIKETDEDQE